MVSACHGGKINIWNIDNNSSFSTNHDQIKSPFNYIQSMETNNDFSRIYAAYNDYIIIDTSTCKIIRELENFDYASDISACPSNINIFASSTGFSKKITIFDERIPTLNGLRILDKKEEICSIQYHPSKDNLLLLGSSNNGIFNVDIRNCKIVFQYNILKINFSCTYIARYNRKGNQIFVTRTHLNSLLFNSYEKQPIFEFNDYWYNNLYLQVKSCFAGPNDEFVVSGSNDFNVYLWEIPKHEKVSKNQDTNLTKEISSAKFILKGHRSFSQQSCYNYKKNILASSGSESKILLWSNFPFNSNSELKKEDFSDDLSHERILFLDLKKKHFYKTNSSIFDNTFENSDDMAFYDKEVFKILVNKYFLEKTCSFEKSFISFEFKYGCKSEEIFKKFERDYRISYLNSIIMNHKLNGKKKNLDLTKLIDDSIEKELKETSKNLHMQQVSSLLLSQKILQTKLILNEAICFLSKELELLKQIIQKIINFKLGLKLCFLFKIESLIKSILKDLKSILEEYKELYEKSLYFYKITFIRVFDLELKLFLPMEIKEFQKYLSSILV